MFQGVYKDPATPSSIEQRAMAAVLAGGKGAAASHRMAVDLLHMRNYRCDLFEILSRRSIAHPTIISHRSRGEPETKTVKGIAVTTPARTMLDCATVLSRPILGRFLETWLSTGVLKLTELETVIDRQRRHPGIRNLELSLAARMITSEEADSPAEALLGELLVRHGLPTPVLHHVVTSSAGATFELDWSYPALMVAFELDGYGVHLRSYEAFERDRIRRNELVLDGWQILNFTKRMLTNKPKTVVDHVTRAIASRSALEYPR